jgi:hypothetical protein
MRYVFPAVLMAAFVGSAGVYAQTAPATIASLIPPPGLEATCLANGTYYRQGTRVCVRSAYGPQVATCGRAENLVKWEFSGTSCEDAAPRP